MNYDVITIGGATEDYTFYTDEGVLIDNKKDVLRQKLLAFEYGAKIKIDKAYSTFGGGAANAAVSLSRLGFNVAILVAVGDDSRGDAILKNLEQQGVSISLAQRKKNNESGFSFLLVGQNNEHIVFSNRASNKKLEITEKDLQNLKYTNWIYMTSLSGEWEKVLDNIFTVHGVKIAWNPGHIQLNTGIRALGKYFKKVKFLVINKDEAIELVISHPKYKNKDLRFLNSVENLLTVIRNWGPETVVITSGKHGADAYDGKRLYHQDILREKKRLDTTGVGDAFGSTFLAGLEYFNGNIKKAMGLAVKNTASVISRQGAQNGLLTKKEILA